MNKIALRAAIATALITPAVVLGAGAASAQPTVTNDGDGMAPIEAKVDPGLGICVMQQPGFQVVLPGGATVKGTTAGDPVLGTCIGLPYFIGEASGDVQ